MLIPLLAQATAGTTADPAAVQPWWHVLIEGAFGLTVLFIFLVAIVTVIFQQRRKDKCLKLMNDYHVSLMNAAGKVMWGDLIVYSNGLELVFDAPYKTSRGLFKTSALLYEKEVEQCLAICRTVDGLTDLERATRRKQIRRSYRPNVLRRSLRWLRNILNTLKDAFSKALSAVIGQISKVAQPGGIMANQKGGVDQIGQTLLGATANAYEPILERHIGKPVVVEMQCPADPDKRVIDIPGYLVDYTEKWIAIFNEKHEPLERFDMHVTESLERTGVKVVVDGHKVKVSCVGPEVLVVRSFRVGDAEAKLDIALINGSTVALSRDDAAAMTLQLERTRRIDAVVPRSQATIYFGGEWFSAEESRAKTKENGIAPESDIEEASDEPLAEDEGKEPLKSEVV